jgi:hypothetical protein
MSPAAARRLRRHERHVCRDCQCRPARFRFRGEVRADRDHTLCFRCYRAEVNRARARRLSEVTTPPPLKMGLAQSLNHVRPRDLFARR